MWSRDSILCFCRTFFYGLTPIIYGGDKSNDIDIIITYEDYPIVSGLVFHNFNTALFLPTAKKPPIEAHLYLFMKRFHTQPSEFFLLDRSMRLNLYKRELDLLEYEAKKAEESRQTNSGKTKK